MNNFQNKKEKQEISKNQFFNGLFNIIAVVLVIMLGLYFLNPQINLSKLGGPAEFGQFGDYIGGVLNPFLTLFMISLAYHALRSQRAIEIDNRTLLDNHRKEISFGQSLKFLKKVQNDKQVMLKIQHFTFNLFPAHDSFKNKVGTLEGNIKDIRRQFNQILPITNPHTKSDRCSLNQGRT